MGQFKCDRAVRVWQRISLYGIFTVLLMCAATGRAQVTFLGSQLQVGGEGFSTPSSVTVDGKGNVYVADRGNNRVVLLAPIANGSSIGYGQAVTVLSGLSGPAGVAASFDGDVFVADTGNNRIVMLPANENGFGQPVTVASGLNNPMGVAVDLADNIYVTDTGNNRVVELPHTVNGFGAPVVVSTGFSNPAGIAIDADRTLYIADTGNGRIVQEPYTSAGYVTQRVVASKLAAPMGVAVDRNYNLFIALTGSSSVMEFTWSAGVNRYSQHLTIGNGFVSPLGVVEDPNGNVLVADGASSTIVEVVAGSAGFGVVNAGSSSVAQAYNFSINAGTAVGSIGVFGRGVSGLEYADAGGSTCVAQLYQSTTTCSVQVRFSPVGSGLRPGAISIYDQGGNTLATTYLSGTGIEAQAGFVPGVTTQLGEQLSGPSGVAVDGSGNVYIADTGNNRVVEVPWSGGTYGRQVTLPVNQLNSPMGLAVDGAGNLFIASNGNDKVIKLPWLGGSFGQQAKIPVNLYGPTAVAVDGAGTLYIADMLDNRIAKLAWNGTGYGKEQGLGNYRKNPMGIGVDPAGNAYFTMPYQNTVVEVPWAAGRYQNQINLNLNGVSFPSVVAADANSNLYVLDTGNNRVLMLPWSSNGFGSQITVASGLNDPQGMTLDGNGNLYIADTGNNRVVKIDLSTPAVVGFAPTYLGSTSADSARSELVENLGNQPLTISSVSYASDFPEDPGSANPCMANELLNSGSSCELAIDFTPRAEGDPLAGAVNVTLSAQSGWGIFQSIAVTGTSSGKLSQAVSFAAIPDTRYGSGSVALSVSASSGLPVTCQVVSGPATITHVGNVLNITGTGPVVIRAVQAGNGMYKAADAVTQNFTALPAVLTVTPVDVNAIYGAVPKSFSYTLSGFVLGQSATQAVSGKAIITTTAGSNAGVGRYTLAAAQGTLKSANYTFVFANGTLTVAKATLQVIASQVSVSYGGVIPELNWIFNGLVNGDSISAVSGAPAMACSAAVGSPVGKYTVTPSPGTLSAVNYDFTFIAGSLSIVPAIVKVTADNQNITYGDKLPAPSYTISGLLFGDAAASVIHGTPAIATNAPSRPGAGTYVISLSSGTLTAANYSFVFVNGLLTVKKAVLAVIPANRTMIYGDAAPALPYAFSGFMNGDTAALALTGTPVIATTATVKTHPGSEAITAAIGSLKSANYDFVPGSGVLTISKRLLTVTPKPAAMTYGAELPVFGYSISGYVNGDTASAISGAPSCSSTAKSSSPVGSYNIECSTGTLASSLYSFTVLNGTLAVKKAVLTVAANSIAMTYGSMTPTLSYTVTGYANGDTSGVISGTPVLSTTASLSSAAGTYGINVDVSKLSAVNYAFVGTPAKITINKAVLTVTPNAASMIYGGAHPAFTYQMTGFLNGDGIGVVSGTPVFKTGATSSSSVGTYAVAGTVGTLSAKNYSFQILSGEITVNKAVATVIADNQSMTYGAALPALTYSIHGLMNGDTAAAAITGTAIMTTSAASALQVGQYSIVASQGTLASANYTFSFKGAVLTVGKAILTVTANNLSMGMGETLPKLTYSIAGLANGDTVTAATSGAAALSTTATSSSAAGSYPIAITRGSMTSSGNYSLRFVDGTLTVTVQASSGSLTPRIPQRRIP